MKRFTIAAALVAVAGIAVLGIYHPSPAEGEGPQISMTSSSTAVVASLLTVFTVEELQAGVAVGNGVCLVCHGGLAGVLDTKHNQALRRPLTQYSLIPGKGVVADYDGNGVDDFQQGLDFNQIKSAFDPFKPNAPILSYQGGEYWITIGQLNLPVVITQGGTGDWKQRYLVRVPVSGTPDGLTADNYVSPVQFNETTSGYVTYHPEKWWDSNGQPLYGPGTSASQVAQEGQSYSKKCIGCHTTGIRSLTQDGNGEWNYQAYPASIFDPSDPSILDYDHNGQPDIVNVGCEACHGLGSKHVLSAGNPSLIVNPRNLSAEENNELCGQCHSRVKSVPGAVHDWPYNDALGLSWPPGGGFPLTDFFTDASGRWPDGKNSRQHHQQWLDFLESSKPGFQFHPVMCVECHNPHRPTSNEHQIREVIVDDGIEIETSNDNDTLCLACHATHGDFSDISVEMVAEYDDNELEIGGVVSEHANHPYGPERSMGLSRCSQCHMPKIATSAVPYDIHSHTFEAIPPEKTLAYQGQGGMPNSCMAGCHGQRVDLYDLGLDTDITDWTQSKDKRRARLLEKWYGPGGIWWDTSDHESLTFDILEHQSARPGEYVLPESFEEDG